MPSVEDTINTTYFGGRIYTAAKSLYLDARKKNADVTLDDVNKWIAKNIVRTKNYKFQNSWVAKGPREEYQIDMFEYKYKQPKKLRVRPFKYQRGKTKSDVEPYGLLAVDTFTKFCWVVPTHFKDKENIDVAINEIFKKMGKPKSIWSDPDSGFLSGPLQELFRNSDVEHNISRLHARVAERTIRTIKGLLKVAVDTDSEVDKLWTAVLPKVLHDYNYKNTHSAIGMTPAEALDDRKEFEVRTNLEIRRKKFRRYPELEVGDKVRVFRKRGTFAKEDTGVWDKDPTVITRIVKSPITGQTMYYVRSATVMNKPFVRSEIWKIDGGPIREAPEPDEKDKAFDRMMKPFDQDAEEEKDRKEEVAREPPAPAPAPAPVAEPKAKAKAKAKAKVNKDVRLAMAMYKRFGLR